ncbi:T9SS type A sorting domain-containing protein [Flavobacterium sp. ZB4P23]|uniref:S8 family serine peptidase n=2 Tax=unclassified Flavobacterium TaxID=196869 RepID=UPI000F82A1B4|nr:S8 family serine peptidase [Flavobacterium sp. ZB4P23]RTY83162.1 T9SS type A sorting domain-containing protein [Flavobacterium sp. ZB4P23]
MNNQGYYGGVIDADMDVEEAWSYTTGNDIKVAIIDEGVDLNHPDLMANLLLGYDATGGNSNGGPNITTDDSHGTACAGIVAAVGNNNLGVAGIAYNSKILPVRIAYTNGYPLGDQRRKWISSDTWIANGISWAVQNGADVLSNSWGGGSPSTTITNAINNAVTNGRNGKGCIVLFSSGNENTAVSYPATLPNVIAVGASSMCDQRKTPTSCDGETRWGSNYGTGIDVIAPGVQIFTTDISGLSGYGTADYISDFNGTSSACPNVAGVVALILSVKPSLTGIEARQILESSTDKINGYSYSSSISGQPNGTWNNEVGYGRINALKAVSNTINFSIVGNSNICASTSNTYTIQNYINGFNTIWTSTSNLTLTNQTNNSVSVIANSSFNSEGTVTATFQNGLTVTKTIWVGKPSLPTFLKGPTTVTTGALVNYSGGTSQGATSYEWWLPYPYDTVNTFDYFGQNWQKLTNYSDSNSIQVFTGYTQNAGLVQFMGKNACGCGGAKTIQVSHGSGGGGQIPRMANPEGSSWYTIYPNPSSDFVNIELRDQSMKPVTNSKIIAELYDLMGHKKAKVEIVNNIATINVAGLPKGIYVLNINIDGQIEGHQVIVE